MAYIIPLNDTLQRLHLTDTFAGVALAGTAVYTPLAVYILYGYLTESGRDRKKLPISMVRRPRRFCGGSSGRSSHQDLLRRRVLTLSHIKTIPVAMSDFFTFERELEWPTAAAALIGSLLPLVVFVTLSHRALEQFSLEPTQRTR